MKVTAKQSFAHGATHYRRGDTLDVSDAVGNALVRAGLVDVGKQKQAAQTKKATTKRTAKTARKQDDADI